MESEKKEPKKKKTLARRILKFFIWFFVVVVLLITLICILLSTSFVQEKITGIASTEVSKLLKTDVKFGEIRYKLFNYIRINDIYIADQNNDTLAYAKHIDIGIKPLEYILHQNIVVDEAIVDGLFLNAYAKDSISDFNYQFLIDEFSSTDTLDTDTTSSTLSLEIDRFALQNTRLRYTILDKIDSLSDFNPSDIEVNNLNAELKIKSINPQALDLEVESFTADEKSGFKIKDISGLVKSIGDKFYIENLNIETPNSYLRPKTVSYDLKSDMVNLDLQDGELSFSDFTPFYPNFKYLTKKLYPTVKISGMLPTIQVSAFDLKYGDHPLLQSSAFISTYEDLSNAMLELVISKFSLTPDILTDFGRFGMETFEMPQSIDIGNIEASANMRGSLSDLKFNGNIGLQESGNLEWEMSGSIDTTFTAFDLVADINLLELNLGKILKTDEIKTLALNTKIQANQKTEDELYVNVDGAINEILFKDKGLKDIPFNLFMDPMKYGFKSAKKFSFGTLDANFMMTKADYPDIDLNIHVDQFKLADFIEYETWNDPILDFDLVGSIKKFNLDDLVATIDLTNLRIKDSNFDYNPGPIALRAFRDNDKTQNITLKSSIADFNLKGNYAFSSLSDELSSIFNIYIPSIFPETKNLKNKNNFTADLSFYNTKSLSQVFNLPFVLRSPLTVSSNINTIDKHITMDAKMPWLTMDSTISIRRATLNVDALDTGLTAKLGTGLNAVNSKFQLGMNLSAFRDTIKTEINLVSDTANFDVDGSMKFDTYLSKNTKNEILANIKIDSTNIRLKDFILNLLPAEIKNIDDKIYVENLGLGLNGKRFFDMNGVISPLVSDTLSLRFTEAEVHDILEGFNVNDVYAEIDGHIKVVGTLNQPSILTDDFSVKNITLYGDTIGSLLLKSLYDQDDRLIHISSYVNKKDKEIAKLKGDINPVSTQMDLNLLIDRFDIGWLKPFLSGYLTDISGNISSELKIQGTTDAPKVEGYFGFNKTKLGIAYTNTNYFISDTIKISSDIIGLKNLEVRDIDGDLAVVNATVTHKDFSDIKFNLDMRAKDLMVLNTVNRTDSLFYGKIFASGNINIAGSTDNVGMKMNVQNAKKSNLYVTIPQVSEATDYKNIVFINTPEEKHERSRNEKTDNTEENLPMNLNIGLKVDPNIKFTIVIDPKTNDRLEAVGNGNLDFQYNMQNELMTVFGDYAMTEGLVKLNLQGLYNIEFHIQNNSKLQFIGDPMKTKFNITAYKRVKADLKALDASFTQNYANTRVTVDCLLGISGDIDNMNLTYNVELVDATDDQINLFNSLVNTSDAKIRQFAYLVTIGSFYPTSSGTGSNFANGMWTSIASSALSAGLNAVINNVLGDNWSLSADITDGSKSVMASTNLLNDRLIISANVGYKDNTSIENVNSQNALIGDFDIQYILSPLWSLKAYSHMNNDFERQGTTIQGVGITYSKNAPTFKQLFESSKKRQFRNRISPITFDKKLKMNAIIDSIRPDSTTTFIIPPLPVDSIKR